MKIRSIQYSLLLSFSCLLFSCNHFTYRPHSKKQRSLERPSIVLCEKIVAFRIAEGGWPTSSSDFMNKGIKYYEVMKNFSYQTTAFVIKDSTKMTFYFSNHKTDLKQYDKTKKIDINQLGGNILFWKENGKFLWKINMK